jgi:exodeoxyribonuclease X
MDREVAREYQKTAHAADTDVYLVFHVLNALIHEFPKGICDLEGMWRLSEEARIPIHMPFGKWRGTPIADVPRDYKVWLLRQDNVDPYLREALQK